MAVTHPTTFCDKPCYRRSQLITNQQSPRINNLTKLNIKSKIFEKNWAPKRVFGYREESTLQRVARWDGRSVLLDVTQRACPDLQFIGGPDEVFAVLKSKTHDVTVCDVIRETWNELVVKVALPFSSGVVELQF